MDLHSDLEMLFKSYIFCRRELEGAQNYAIEHPDDMRAWNSEKVLKVKLELMRLLLLERLSGVKRE